MEDGDMAIILSQLPSVGADDYVARVMEIYKRVGEVSAASESTYWAAVQAGTAGTGFSSSANF